MKLAACRSCNASIVWAITGKGKRIPLDANPTDDGTMILEDRADSEPGTVYAPMAAGPKHRSHFSTCPDAAKWRKPA